MVNGTGVGQIETLALSGSTLYAGGLFDHVGETYDASTGTLSGGVAANSVAEYADGAWRALATGAANCSGCGNANVNDLTVWNGTLFITGNFSSAGGDGTPNNAQWNGSKWSAIGPNLNGDVNQLLTTSSGVIAAGGFTQTSSGSAILYDLALWNGSTWTGYGLGASDGASAGGLYVLSPAGHKLYAAGNFSNAGWTPTTHLAELNGGSWQTLGSSLRGGGGYVSAIAVSGSDVYVGGNFTAAGSVSASNIATWNGSALSSLGSGVDGTVSALTFYNGMLWAGGNFAHAGSSVASDVAIWNPTTKKWSPVGDDAHFDGNVNALAGLPAPDNHYMVIGGDFTDVDTGGTNPAYVKVNSLVYFDTNTTNATNPVQGYYSLTGTGGSVGVLTNSSEGSFAGTVNALATNGTTVYIGGQFNDGGNVVSNGFAADNLNATPNGWSSPGAAGGGSASGIVNAIRQVGSDYYVGGIFTTAGGTSANNVAE